MRCITAMPLQALFEDRDWEDEWRVRQRASIAVVSRRVHAQM